MLNYPLYYPIISFLNSSSGTTAPLVTAISDIKSQCKDVSLLGTFSENHDLPRFASMTQDLALAKNALALTLLWDGIPIVYAGQEQHYAGYGDPGNREATWLAAYSRQSELYNLLAAANQVRNRALEIDDGYATYGVDVVYSTQNVLAVRKGSEGKQIVSVFTNAGSSSTPYAMNLANTGWAAGTKVLEVLTCEEVVVAGDGALPVTMDAGLPRIFFASEAASGSGICAGTGTPTGTVGDQTPSGGMVKGRRRMAAAAAGVVA